MKRLIIKFFHALIYFFFVFLFGLFFPISNLLYANKKIWIITERGYDARDNGLHFFKYVIEKHPEVNCYYAIDKNSPDYKRLDAYRNILQFGSLKHIFLFACAKAKISTQMFGYAPNKYYVKLMEKYHLQGKNIGLKHGIFKNLHPNYFKNNSHLDLIICGADPEYKFIKEYFGYNENEVAYCGLARFDNLTIGDIVNQILVMPTFRIPLAGLKREEFAETEYFKKWFELLQTLDNSVLNFKGAKIVFYLHAKFQKYAELFEKSFDNITIAHFDEYDVQDLLKNSSILITDYSSVFFDFAYMEKPSIYYQFDEDYFNKNHYEKGYFDYRRDGFGKVVLDKNECLKELNNIIKNNSQLDCIYRKRVREFFTLPADGKNCERIFVEINKII